MDKRLFPPNFCETHRRHFDDKLMRNYGVPVGFYPNALPLFYEELIVNCEKYSKDYVKELDSESRNQDDPSDVQLLFDNQFYLNKEHDWSEDIGNEKKAIIRKSSGCPHEESVEFVKARKERAAALLKAQHESTSNQQMIVTDQQSTLDQPNQQQQSTLDQPNQQQQSTLDQPNQQQQSTLDQPNQQQQSTLDQPNQQQQSTLDQPNQQQQSTLAQPNLLQQSSVIGPSELAAQSQNVDQAIAASGNNNLPESVISFMPRMDNLQRGRGRNRTFRGRVSSFRPVVPSNFQTRQQPVIEDDYGISANPPIHDLQRPARARRTSGVPSRAHFRGRGLGIRTQVQHGQLISVAPAQVPPSQPVQQLQFGAFGDVHIESNSTMSVPTAQLIDIPVPDVTPSYVHFSPLETSHYTVPMMPNLNRNVYNEGMGIEENPHSTIPDESVNSIRNEFDQM